MSAAVKFVYMFFPKEQYAPEYTHVHGVLQNDPGAQRKLEARPRSSSSDGRPIGVLGLSRSKCSASSEVIGHGLRRPRALRPHGLCVPTGLHLSSPLSSHKEVVNRGRQEGFLLTTPLLMAFLTTRGAKKHSRCNVV